MLWAAQHLVYFLWLTMFVHLQKKSQLVLGIAQSLIVFWLPLSCSPEEGNGKSRLLRQQLLFHTKARVPQNWKEKGQQPPCKLKACLASFPRRCWTNGSQLQWGMLAAQCKLGPQPTAGFDTLLKVPENSPDDLVLHSPQEYHSDCLTYKQTKFDAYVNIYVSTK